MDGGMIHRLRILLLEPNRYLALLMEREIAQTWRSAVIARYENEQAATEELGRTRYDIAVVDLESSIAGRPGLLSEIRESSPRIVIIAVAPRALLDQDAEKALRSADRIVPKDDRTPGRLPGIIEELADLWQRVERTDDGEGVLSAESRSAVVNLTVRTLAHEINNPLMTIMGTTELLLDSAGEVSEGEQEKIRMIQDSARRIQATLAELAGDQHPGTRRTPVGLMLKSRKQAATVK